MYEQTFSRQNPGCLILLIDRSDSMKLSWAGSGMTLAHGAARAVNRILLELCIKSTKEQGAALRNYFYIGIYGYGLSLRGDRECVESVLPTPLASRGIVPLSELADHPLAIREEEPVDRMPTGVRVPVWYEPAHGYRTPMCQAIALAGAHAREWAEAFPHSFPPIVVNITDGLVTDSPYEDVDLSGWARRLTSITTLDGSTLLMNAFISASTDPVTSFPSTATSLPAPGADLFDISSPLPERMIQSAVASYVTIDQGARGIVFNADMATLVKFLEIGTRFDLQNEIQESADANGADRYVP